MKRIKINWTETEGRNARILDREEDGSGCTVLLGANGGGIAIRQLKGARERYLIGDVEVLEDHSAAMMFRCFPQGAEKEKIYMRFGLLPRFKRVCQVKCVSFFVFYQRLHTAADFCCKILFYTEAKTVVKRTVE